MTSPEMASRAELHYPAAIARILRGLGFCDFDGHPGPELSIGPRYIVMRYCYLPLSGDFGQDRSPCHVQDGVASGRREKKRK